MLANNYSILIGLKSSLTHRLYYFRVFSFRKTSLKHCRIYSATLPVCFVQSLSVVNISRKTKPSHQTHILIVTIGIAKQWIPPFQQRVPTSMLLSFQPQPPKPVKWPGNHFLVTFQVAVKHSSVEAFAVITLLLHIVGSGTCVLIANCPSSIRTT